MTTTDDLGSLTTNVALGALGSHRLPQASADWADRLIDLLRLEVTCAARRGLITMGESDQLLARLVLVIDQALSTG